MYIYIKELENQEEIQQLKKVPKWIRKWIGKIIYKMNWIMENRIEENRKVYLIPNLGNKNREKRIRKKLEREPIQKLQLILSHKMRPYQEQIKGYKIIEGRRIFEEALEEILRQILQENLLVMQDIYVLANRYQEKNTKIIRRLASKVKSINIVTKEIEKYKILEEMIQEDGIAISVANNKRKSLKKAKIIINLDFSKEELTQYSIFRNAIIINSMQERINNLKAFEGIIIQDIEVELGEERKNWLRENRLENKFSSLELFESFAGLEKQEGKIQVTNLYGNNGEIDKKELRNWQKILTNEKN